MRRGARAIGKKLSKNAMDFLTFFKITPEPFALDLSDRSIKIIKFARKRGEFFLENFGELNIDPGLMEDGAILDEAKLASAVRDAIMNLKKGPLKTPYAACSLPEQRTYLRVIQLPKMEEKDVVNAVQWEVEANVPVPLNELYFDYQVIKPLANHTDHLDILVSAAPRSLVEGYVKLFSAAGLKPFSFEPESVALARALVKGGVAQKPTLIVDLGRTRTSFLVYAGRGLRLSSSVKLSGAVITENIMRALKVDEEEAVRLKEEVGINPKENGALYEAIIPALTDFKEQVQKYIEFYYKSSGHTHGSVAEIGKILLVGGGARIWGFDKYLAVALGIPVEIANPWVNILKPPLKEVPELAFGESTRYATAIGLALGTVQNVKT